MSVKSSRNMFKPLTIFKPKKYNLHQKANCKLHITIILFDQQIIKYTDKDKNSPIKPVEIKCHKYGI